MKNEPGLRKLIEDVRSGRLPRRSFIGQMVGLGLTAPMASMMLMHAGIAQAQTAPAYKPTKRGGGGALKVLWWQAPTLLQPHFAQGTKDQEASRIFYEPLGVWDNDGNLVPILAAEVPTKDNGGLSADGRSVTWKLKRGVTWHDGQPFTADDCVFTWEYAKDPATAAVTVFAPAFGPRTKEETAAMPWELVTAVAPVTVPPPLVTVKTTVTLGTGSPSRSLTMTPNRSARAKPARPSCP